MLAVDSMLLGVPLDSRIVPLLPAHSGMHAESSETARQQNELYVQYNGSLHHGHLLV